MWTLVCGLTPLFKVFGLFTSDQKICVGHQRYTYSECVCVRTAKRDNAVNTYLVLDYINIIRKHDQIIVCQVLIKRLYDI